jgi:hypothetical protein
MHLKLAVGDAWVRGGRDWERMMGEEYWRQRATGEKSCEFEGKIME